MNRFGRHRLRGDSAGLRGSDSPLRRDQRLIPKREVRGPESRLAHTRRANRLALPEIRHLAGQLSAFRQAHARLAKQRRFRWPSEVAQVHRYRRGRIAHVVDGEVHVALWREANDLRPQVAFVLRPKGAGAVLLRLGEHDVGAAHLEVVDGVHVALARRQHLLPQGARCGGRDSVRGLGEACRSRCRLRCNVMGEGGIACAFQRRLVLVVVPATLGCSERAQLSLPLRVHLLGTADGLLDQFLLRRERRLARCFRRRPAKFSRGRVLGRKAGCVQPAAATTISRRINGRTVADLPDLSKVE